MIRKTVLAAALAFAIPAHAVDSMSFEIGRGSEDTYLWRVGLQKWYRPWFVERPWTLRAFSTNFQYGDHIGVGARFGERYRYDLSLRLQHLSNGGLAHPNPGINFLQMRLAYHFD